MKVKITNYGWNGGSSASMYTPWYRYLCQAANGIITWVNTSQYIEDGEYELSDKDWSWDNPRWDAEADSDCEIIEVA